MDHFYSTNQLLLNLIQYYLYLIVLNIIIFIILIYFLLINSFGFKFKYFPNSNNSG